ncbi:MAG: hypothetical protein FJ137_13730 [Deltaproteobacteria bacterium]|nr:hypothetical protein [Deltaproteobacteria bacterium]
MGLVALLQRLDGVTGADEVADGARALAEWRSRSYALVTLDLSARSWC